jgi:hypothetical protein
MKPPIKSTTKASENQLKYFSTTDLVFSPFQPTRPAYCRCDKEPQKVNFCHTSGDGADFIRQRRKAAGKNNLEKTGENSYELTYN